MSAPPPAEPRAAGPLARPIDETDAEPEAPPAPYWRQLRLAGAVVIVLLLVGYAVFSVAIYRRFLLSSDFATYNQAWTLIGEGHLDPVDTLRGFPFLRSDFELIVWPLALVHLVVDRPIALLWIQDVAVAACAYVTYVWVLEYLEYKRLSRWTAVAVAVAVLLVSVADAGSWLTVRFDVHMEPITTLFLLLAGRQFWWGRHRRAFGFVAAALLCGTFAAVMVVGLGVSALLAGRATRRSGAVLVAVAVVWMLLIAALHADVGSEIQDYSYLAGRTVLPAGGVVLVLKGIVSHPGRALHTLASRWPFLWDHVRAVGVLGVASAWGVGVPVVVMLTSALDSHSNFAFSSFQNFGVLPFVLLGTVMLLVWAAERLPRGGIVAGLVALLVLGEALAYGYQQDSATIRQTTGLIPAGAAAMLSATLSKTPADAEVVSTIGNIGRFSSRPYCYRVVPNLVVPLHGVPVVFVFSTEPLEIVTREGVARAVTYVRNELRARPLADGDGVTSFLWVPPRGATEVQVPTTPA